MMYLKRKNKKIIATLGLLCSAPLVVAAAQVTLTDGNPNSDDIICQQSGQVGMVVAANGNVTISLADLACLQNTNTNIDTDGDGYSDLVELAEDPPTDPNSDASKPADLDGDFIPDSTDSDIDGDGYSNAVELAEEPPTDPNSATSKPADLDGDGTPDSIDLDIDGDGHSNAVELAANPPSDPLNPNSVPQETTIDSLARESDIVDRFNHDYFAYSSKEALGPQLLTSNDKVYIVNQGYVATSVPSCVNGKYPQTGCKPTGWTMGIKKDDIFAVRHMTRSTYSGASIQITRNQKAEGSVVQANYIFNLSDKPGDMTGTPFNGRCKVETSSSAGGLWMVPTGAPLLGYKCEIPNDTAFYVNVKLAPSSYDRCETGICSGYFYENGLDVGEDILTGVTF